MDFKLINMLQVTLESKYEFEKVNKFLNDNFDYDILYNAEEPLNTNDVIRLLEVEIDRSSISIEELRVFMPLKTSCSLNPDHILEFKMI